MLMANPDKLRVVSITLTMFRVPTLFTPESSRFSITLLDACVSSATEGRAMLPYFRFCPTNVVRLFAQSGVSALTSDLFHFFVVGRFR